MSLTNSPFWFSSGASAGGGAFYPYSIDQSLRFEDGDTAYLSRTPSSASNRKTSTLSVWVKRSKLGADQVIFTVDAAANDANRMQFRFGNGDDLRLAGNFTTYLATNAKFRDVSSWYHIVLAIDTTQATASDRLSLYVNGEKITSFSASSYPSQNADLPWNLATLHGIGSDTGGIGSGNNFDGYMAEVNFIDGTALDPTSFGETINGIWVPKAYDTADGAYSTNGFYLDFSDNSTATALGTDSSGNGNDFSVNNLATTDQVLDSPTNSFPTLNSLQVSSNITLAEGNLKSTTTNTASSHQAYSTMNIPTSGKWYFECYAVLPRADDLEFGISEIPTPDDRTANHLTSQLYNASADACAILNNTAGNLTLRAQTGGGIMASGITGSTGDIYQIAFDCDTGKVFLGRNNTYYRVAAADGDPSAGTNPSKTITANKEYCIGLSCYGGNGAGGGIINYGQDSTFAGATTAGGNADDNGIGDFKYAPPSGFLALNSANLPEVTIGPNSTEQADDYFDTKLWSSDVVNPSAGQKQISLNFQPDWVWSKNRDNAEHHYWMDSVRGDNDGSKWLKSNATAAEGGDAVGSTTAKYDFTSTGFDIIDTNSASGEVYYNNGNAATPRTYVGWCWKAGGTAVSNTSGSITSQVSANPDAGFSIVSWTGNATNPSTIGHGLSSAPEMIILKNRDSTGDWYIGHDDIGWTDRLKFTDAATASSSTLWNNTAPTSSVFTISSALNFNGDATIAYCFHSVSGYSSVGSYVGNGSTDGTFVYTGFRPAFVLLKAISGTNNWSMYDNQRDVDNVVREYIIPNQNAAAASTDTMDFVSNGFKVRNSGAYINTSGTTYIYLAFAEAPFKYANAR